MSDREDDEEEEEDEDNELTDEEEEVGETGGDSVLEGGEALDWEVLGRISFG